MKSAPIAAALALLLVRSASGGPKDELRLVMDGKARVSVVLPARCGAMVKAAASDLARCLGKAVGAPVPIVTAPSDANTPLTIELGSPSLDASGLARDGCAMKTEGRRLIISGGSDSGISNGIYTFLIEQVGVHWFIPDPLYEVIPRRPEMVLPNLDYRRDPDFRYRMMPGTQGPAGPEWERRNRLEPDQSGIARYNFGHNMNTILPVSKYGKTNPEYYPMVDGVRKLPVRDWSTNPCFTNPDVIRITAEAAHVFYREHPELDTFAVTINDSSDHCHCPACEKLDAGLPPGQSGGPAFSESYFHFVDEVAKLVAKSDPDKFVGCLPYWPVYPLPRFIDRLPDNVVVLLTQDTSQQHNPRYAKAERNHWLSWREKVRSIGRYDYYELGWLTPRYYPHIAAADLKFIAANGCDGFLCPIAPAWCILGPHVYVASRLLWDSSLDVDALLDEYYRSLFGTAAPKMKRFYADLERYWLKPREPHWFEGLAGNTSEYTIVNGPLIDDAWNALRQAETVATGIELERVRDMEVHFRLPYLLVKMQWDARRLASAHVSSRAQLDALADRIVGVLAYMPDAEQVYDRYWKPSLLYNGSYYNPDTMKDRLRDWGYEARKWLTIAAARARRFVDTLPGSGRDAAWGSFHDKLLARDADLGTQRLVRDLRSEFDRSDRAIRNGDGYSDRSDRDGTLATAESCLTRAYVDMYRATGDRGYLRRLVSHFDRFLSLRDNRLDVVDAAIAEGPAQFVRLVTRDRSLQPEFGAKSAQYRQRIAACIRDAESGWRNGPQSDEGCYHDAMAGGVLRLSEQNAMGLVLIEMHGATGDRGYLDKATRLAHFFHRRLRYVDSDYYDWAQWPRETDDGEDSEDISHAGIDVAFAARCADEGIAFTKRDTGRIARTWLQQVRKSDGTWAGDIAGGGQAGERMPAAVADWLLLCPQLLDHVATKLYQSGAAAYAGQRLYSPAEMLGVARLLRFAPGARGGR